MNLEALADSEWSQAQLSGEGDNDSHVNQDLCEACPGEYIDEEFIGEVTNPNKRFRLMVI